MDDDKRGLEENVANVERLPIPIPIANEMRSEMSKCESIQFRLPVGNGVVSPKPWTVKVATLLIDVLCAVVAWRLIGSEISCWRFELRDFLLSFWVLAVDAELHRGRTWIRGLVTLMACASFALLVNPSLWAWCAIVPLVGAAVLLRLPPSNKWYACAAAAEGMERLAWWRKAARVAYRTLIALPFVIASLCAFLIVPAIPGMRKFARLCAYPTKDALIAAEPQEVSRTIDFTQNGTNYTAVVLSCIGFLPSGPAVIIYDADGYLIDRCSDSGDNMSFNERWHFNFARENQKEIERSSP